MSVILRVFSIFVLWYQECYSCRSLFWYWTFFNRFVEYCGHIFVCCCKMFNPKILDLVFSRGFLVERCSYIFCEVFFTHLFPFHGRVRLVMVLYPTRLFVMYHLFLIYFSPEVLYVFFVWCVFHIGACLPKAVIKFFAICFVQLVVIVLALSFLVSD